MPCIYRTRSKNNLLAPHLPTISTKLHSVEEEEEQQCFNQIIPFHAHCTLHILVRQMIGRNFRLQPTTKCCLLKVAPRIWLQGHITVGYRGSFAIGRGDMSTTGFRYLTLPYLILSHVITGFRKLTRILVCGKSALCREVFRVRITSHRHVKHAT